MIGFLLAFMSAIAWGVADYIAGRRSRQVPVLFVAAISQIVGLVLIVSLTVSYGFSASWESAYWAGSAGVCGAIGLGLLYRGLATGAMSVVAPISACGALVPVAVTFLRGDVPSFVAILGIPITVAGAALVAAEKSDQKSTHQSSTYNGVKLKHPVFYALTAAIFLGSFFALMQTARISGESDELALVAIARVVSSFLLTVALLRSERYVLKSMWHGFSRAANRSIDRKTLGAIALVGIFDVSATSLFVVASAHANGAVVAVLSSLYPLATVALAHIFLKERLAFHQRIGVGCAIVGVACLAGG